MHPCCHLQIEAIKAAAVERQSQVNNEAQEVRRQQDELTAKLKVFQQQASGIKSDCRSGRPDLGLLYVSAGDS